MTAIFNPGSGGVGQSGEGWANTYEGAEAEAQRWLAEMQAEGFTDVHLELPGVSTGEGRWVFKFRQQVTGFVVELETHGITDMDAYRKSHIFTPRVYWNGSSCGNPKLEDFAVPGFVPVMTYREVEK